MLKHEGERMNGEEEAPRTQETPIDDKLDVILRKLELLENRISQIEENTASILEERKKSKIELRPKTGQPIVPNLYRDIYLERSIDMQYAISDSEVDVTPIINESLEKVLLTLYNNSKEDEETNTITVAKKLDLSRSTISSRLNLLFRLGLVNKKVGRKTKYALTKKGKKVINVK